MHNETPRGYSGLGYPIMDEKAHNVYRRLRNAMRKGRRMPRRYLLCIDPTEM